MQASDIMDQHANSFKLPDQAFKPRILKTDVQSRLRDLRVYHPPSRKGRPRDYSELQVRKHVHVRILCMNQRYLLILSSQSLRKWPMKFCVSFMEATCVAQRLIDITTRRILQSSVQTFSVNHLICTSFE